MRLDDFFMVAAPCCLKKLVWAPSSCLQEPLANQHSWNSSLFIYRWCVSYLKHLFVSYFSSNFLDEILKFWNFQFLRLFDLRIRDDRTCLDFIFQKFYWRNIFIVEFCILQYFIIYFIVFHHALSKHMEIISEKYLFLLVYDVNIFAGEKHH